MQFTLCINNKAKKKTKKDCNSHSKCFCKRWFKGSLKPESSSIFFKSSSSATQPWRDFPVQKHHRTNALIHQVSKLQWEVQEGEMFSVSAASIFSKCGCCSATHNCAVTRSQRFSSSHIVRETQREGMHKQREKSF